MKKEGIKITVHAVLAFSIIIIGVILIHYSGPATTFGSVGVKQETTVYCLEISGADKIPINNPYSCCAKINEFGSCDKLSEIINIYYGEGSSLDMYSPRYVCFRQGEAKYRIYFDDTIKKFCKVI
jgi:hypothetical protein